MVNADEYQMLNKLRTKMGLKNNDGNPHSVPTFGRLLMLKYAQRLLTEQDLQAELETSLDVAAGDLDQDLELSQRLNSMEESLLAHLAAMGEKQVKVQDSLNKILLGVGHSFYQLTMAIGIPEARSPETEQATVNYANQQVQQYVQRVSQATKSKTISDDEG